MQSEIFVLNKTENICYYGKLEENLDPLHLSMISTIDPEKLYPVYLNLAYWEKASGKNLKLTKTMTIQSGHTILYCLKLVLNYHYQYLMTKLFYQQLETEGKLSSK